MLVLMQFLPRQSRVGGLLAAAMLLALVTIPAAASEWLRMEDDGFTFVGDVSERRLKQIAGDLRMFRHAVGRFITNEPSGDAMPVSVFAVSHDSWEKYVRPREHLGGVFVPGYFSADILIDAESGWDAARTVVYHEFTHHYVHNLDKFPYPAWFHEGLAQFLGTTVRQGRELILGRMPYGPWLDPGASAWIPMKRLLMVNFDSPEYRGHDAANQFYGQSWLLMHYLLVPDPERRNRLASLLDGMVNSEDPDSALDASLGLTSAALDAELQGYFRRQNFRILTIPAPAAIEKVTERPRAISEAQSLRELGLAALRARPDDAGRVVPVFSRLLSLKPNDHTGMAGLALALRASGKGEEAARWIAAVAREPNAEARALRLCGAYHTGAIKDASNPNASLSRARECYQRALRTDPGDYEALITLVELENDPDPGENDERIAALERARKRFPQNEFLGFALAKCYFNAGRADDSLATLRRAVAATRDPALRRQMSALVLRLTASIEHKDIQ